MKFGVKRYENLFDIYNFEYLVEDEFFNILAISQQVGFNINDFLEVIAFIHYDKYDYLKMFLLKESNFKQTCINKMSNKHTVEKIANENKIIIIEANLQNNDFNIKNPKINEKTFNNLMNSQTLNSIKLEKLKKFIKRGK